MREIGNDYQTMLEDQFSSDRPMVPFFSSVTGKVIAEPNQLGPSYWRSNLESPVLFYSAIQEILNESHQYKLFLEVGPHSALGGPLRQIFRQHGPDKCLTYVPTMLRDVNCTKSLLTAVGQMYLQGVRINFDAVTPGKTVLTSLPKYPWHYHTKYWHESRTTRDWRLRKFPIHELLGSRILEGNDVEPTWRIILRLEDVPWLQDHMIHQDIVFPAAGYISMIGEAIRQIAGAADFTLRNVVIKTALLLEYSKPVEMITTVRPVRLTTDLDSAWFEFSILSYNGTSWTSHCVGQVKEGSTQTQESRAIAKGVRQVSSSSWYKAMKRVGLNYGPHFQGLAEITTDPNFGSATASLLDQKVDSETRYLIHPTTIDMFLQLFTVAVSHGSTRRLTKLCIPVGIEELYIRQGGSKIEVEAVISRNSQGEFRGNALATADGEVVMNLKQGRFSSIEEDTTGEVDTVAGAQMFWKPDIDFVPVNHLVHARKNVDFDVLQVERLALLCMLETRQRVSSIQTEIKHLNRFRSWLDLQATRAESEKYELVAESKYLASLEAGARCRAIESARKDLKAGAAADVGNMIFRVLDNCEAIFKGHSEPIDILIQDNGLGNLYDSVQHRSDWSRFLKLLGHSNPGLKILEIGAGTGGATAAALQALRSENSTRTYSQYHYTDVSAGFFLPAKERFKQYGNIQFSVLDIGQDPSKQGFEAESYDLVVASNVSDVLHLPIWLSRGCRFSTPLPASSQPFITYESYSTLRAGCFFRS